jgi:2-hydroxycyclohexanecarboxyl-CoA dehydrogenase
MNMRSSARRTGVAVVTGAASGIGAAVSAALRTGGWRVAGVDLHAAQDVDLSLIADVADADAVATAMARVEQQLGPAEALVSAAGHYQLVDIADITPDEWTRMMTVHLGGAVNTIRCALPGMVERRQGAIVAITSELAIGGGAGDAHYAAAKGAIIGLIKSLAVEVAGHGVRVNSVAPGPTDTPLLAADSPWRAPEYLATLPLRRLVRPDEVAAAVVYLIEEGTFCAGEVLSPNAGAVI